ncbi:MAG: circularly permuted type 2 ATP-grasp protein [Firmicutes bacterium]|nr:circularly permuted type 2 ATP-grasp protein [Bacillota bacterium]
MEYLADEESLAFSGYDEYIDSDAKIRDIQKSLHKTMSALGRDGIERRIKDSEDYRKQRGVTFSVSGSERPFPLDVIPRILNRREFSLIEAGVRQRVLALEAFLDDIYGSGEVFQDGVIPKKIIMSSGQYYREACNIAFSKKNRIVVAGIDVVRNTDGHFYVMEDNIRVPSGVAYVLENRKTMETVFPELLKEYDVEKLNDYVPHLSKALLAAKPPGAGKNCKVVLLTPGVYNSAYFEHSYLAIRLGIELVEGNDLVCMDNVCYLKTGKGLERVDVIYKRIDDDFLDPVHFRHDSLLGCPGLINAAIAGNLSIVNAVGNGVADDKLVYTYVPDFIRYYLGEEPILSNVPTYRLEERDELHYVLENMEKLVIKPANGSGGHGIVIGPQADEKELEELRADIWAHPRDYIAQEVVNLSSAPVVEGGELKARHIDFRPFAINDGEGVFILRGGLTRVSSASKNLIVNSSQGGGSKDTWVTDEGRYCLENNCSDGVTGYLEKI